MDSFYHRDVLPSCGVAQCPVRTTRRVVSMIGAKKAASSASDNLACAFSTSSSACIRRATASEEQRSAGINCPGFCRHAGKKTAIVKIQCGVCFQHGDPHWRTEEIALYVPSGQQILHEKLRRSDPFKERKHLFLQSVDQTVDVYLFGVSAVGDLGDTPTIGKISRAAGYVEWHNEISRVYET